MAGRVISIEIGYLLTRVCEVDFKSKTPKVYKSFTVPTVDGVVADGVITPNTHYVEALRGGLRENKIRSRQVVFSISSAKIATREAVIPYVKENRIGDVVRANAADYFPVDLSQYELAYSILGTLGEKTEMQQHKLIVLAIPKNVLDGYYALAASLRLEIAAFDYAGNSVYQIMKKECAEGTQMIAKIDERTTQVVVIREQQVVFTRNVPYGVEEALHVVMESEAWGPIRSMRQTLQVIEQNQCIRLADQDMESKGADSGMSSEEEAQTDVTDALMAMIGSIARVIDYYTSQGSNTPIDRVLVTGIGANFMGMDELLKREIRYPVISVRKVEGMNLERYFKGGFFGEYLACIGAAISPLGIVADTEKKKKVTFEVLPSKGNMMHAAIMVCVGGFIIGTVLAVVSVMGYRAVCAEQERMNNRIAELEPAEKVYKEYLQQQYTFHKLTYFQNNTVTPNEDLVAFIEEMEEKMPESLNVQSFNADLEGVTMSLTVENKDDAAWLVQQFRTFDTVDVVETSNIIDTGAVMDGQIISEEPLVTFTVSVAYKGSDAQAAIEAANAAAEAEAANTEEENQAE